jgi:hypothetical protein
LVDEPDDVHGTVYTDEYGELWQQTDKWRELAAERKKENERIAFENEVLKKLFRHSAGIALNQQKMMRLLVDQANHFSNIAALAGHAKLLDFVNEVYDS